MIAIFNKFKRGILPMYLMLAIFTASIILVSCSKDDDLEIQNDFPFEVNVMPVPKEVANGETVEIRITINRSANYQNTQYYLRYFQFDGQGILRYYNELPYLPNDFYQLPQEQFRLYYTSTSTVTQAFEVWISDSFGNEKQLSFQFSSSD